MHCISDYLVDNHITLSTKNETDLTEFILPGLAASLLSEHIETED